MISHKANVSHGNVDFSFYTRRFALGEDFHRKRMDMLAYSPVKFVFEETLAKIFFIPARQNQFFQEKNSTKLQFVALLLEWTQTLHSPDRTLKIYSGINNLILDTLEYSQEVSQS